MGSCQPVNLGCLWRNQLYAANVRIWTPPHLQASCSSRHGTTAYVYPERYVHMCHEQTSEVVQLFVHQE